MSEEVLIFAATQIASTSVYACVIALVGLLLACASHPRDALLFVLTNVVVGLMVLVLKELFAIPRPAGARVPIDGYAFPSGHAASAFALLAAYYCYVRPHLPVTWGCMLLAVLTVLAVLVAYSRVWLVVHTYSQIIAGALLGLTVPLAAWYVSQRINRGRLSQS